MGSYLTRYDSENNPAEQWKLVRQFMHDDPLGFFRELRETRPIFVTPECTLVARYDDVVEMLGLPKIFTVALYEPKMSNNYLMMNDDNALHSREKSIMQGLLNRDDLPEVRRMVGEIGKKILDDAHGRMDAVNEYCRMTPATIVRDYFGLIGMHRKELIDWSYWAQADTFYNQPFDVITPEERLSIQKSHDESGKKLAKYLAALILVKKITYSLEAMWGPMRRFAWHLLSKVIKRGRIQEDIVTRMMRARFPPDLKFDIQRIGANAGGLLIGAIETTAQATAQAMQYFLERPELLEQAKEAATFADPKEFDGLVWEALRFVPISPYVFRRTASAYTLAKGTDHPAEIPPDTNVLALTQSAMFDRRIFEDPEEFRAGRNWYHYFTFGYGSHECLGKYVGMVMIPEMVRQVLLMPGLKAEGKIEYKGHLPASYQLRWDT